MNIGFIVEKRYLKQHMPGAAIERLRARGHRVEIILPHKGCFDLSNGVLEVPLYKGDLAELARVDMDSLRYDIIVSRNRNPTGLVLLAYAEEFGIPTLNTHSAVRRIRNKAKMAVVLQVAGIPMPRTFVADRIDRLAEVPRELYPLILKATYGDNSQGLRLVRDPEELIDVRWYDGLVLAQQYLPNDGYDYKLYVIGRQVFAVRKPSPLRIDKTGPAEPVTLTSEMCTLALRCGKVFGLEIYGVDVVMTPDGLSVIEVNDFPNYAGALDADERLIDYIVWRAQLEQEKAS